MDYLDSVGCPLMDSVSKSNSDPKLSGHRPDYLPDIASSRPSSSGSLLDRRQSVASDMQCELQNSERQPTKTTLKASECTVIPSQNLPYTAHTLRASNDMPPPRLSKSAGRIESSGAVTAPFHQEQRNVSRFFPNEDEQSQRPATAPLEHHADHVIQAMPPRRELPFKSSSSVRSTSSFGKDQGSRSSSVVVELPPLPQPRVVQGGGQVCSTHTDTMRKSSQSLPSMNPERHTVQSSRNAFVSRHHIAFDPTTSSSSAQGLSSSPPFLATRSPTEREHRSIANEIQAPNARVVNAQYAQYLSGGKAPIRGSETNDVLPSEGARYSDRSNTAQVPSHPSIVGDKDSLAGYADQSEEERMDALESMICGLIDDDDFLKLSEDVESCWRRIGLAR